jgi:hypothetical protein
MNFLIIMDMMEDQSVDQFVTREQHSYRIVYIQFRFSK